MPYLPVPVVAAIAGATPLLPLVPVGLPPQANPRRRPIETLKAT
ncbi:hypothetical protein [Streptosporangium subroseum]|nr:hypothetical protein OHB15_15490 [Streptosporangium subroseum]